MIFSTFAKNIARSDNDLGLAQEKMTVKQDKQDIRKLSVDQLKSWMTEHGEKGFRGKQIYEWIWKKSVSSFAEMTNLRGYGRREREPLQAIENAPRAKARGADGRGRGLNLVA